MKEIASRFCIIEPEEIRQLLLFGEKVELTHTMDQYSTSGRVQFSQEPSTGDNGTSWEQFLDLQGQENIWNNLRDEAQKRIKNSLVLEHISKVENIKLEDDAIEKKVSEMAKMYNTDEKTVYNQMSKNPQILQSLIQQLISQNIIDFLVENNKVNYVTK